MVLVWGSPSGDDSFGQYLVGSLSFSFLREHSVYNKANAVKFHITMVLNFHEAFDIGSSGDFDNMFASQRGDICANDHNHVRPYPLVRLVRKPIDQSV